MVILVINAGSSSLKYQVIETDTKEVLAKGNYERIGDKKGLLTHKVNGEKYKFEKDVKDHGEALNIILEKLTDKTYNTLKSINDIDAVGHRFTHGGSKFTKPVLVDDTVFEELKETVDLAPLHNPSAIKGIQACRDMMKGIPNVACFDTSFHQTISEEKYTYPIPMELTKKYNIRKYGFHGLSHEYISRRIVELKKCKKEDIKVINCHLGQGASICAIKDGKSVETSMGFTPVAGIPMGSRCGDLDPSVVTYIMEKENLTPKEMETILNKKSGIYGVSGISVDFRDVEDAAFNKNEHDAKLAMDIFLYEVASTIAKYMVALDGVDVITFTAGVGEKGIEDREFICDYLKVFGVEIDKKINDSKNIEGKISTKNSKIEVWVIPTNEELLIANETEKLLSK